MILSSCIGVFDGSIPFEKIVAVLKFYGYAGIELLGEPKKYNLHKLKSLLKSVSLNVTALTACSRLKTGRDLASKDKTVREKTIDHYKECLHMACDLSSPLVGVSLTAIGRYWIEDNYYAEVQRALESLEEIINEAKKLKKTIIIETPNRYVSFMMNTIKECKEFIVSNHLSNVGICPDLFHMNIEEPNLCQSIKQSASLLKNLHVADSNRRGIGYGHINFNKIYKTLVEIKYEGPLSLEAWASTKNPFSNVDSSFDEIESYLAGFSKIFKELSNK